MGCVRDAGRRKITVLAREGLSRHTPCIGATATRHGAAGITGSPGTGETADVAVMGQGRRHREEGCPQGPRLRLEPRRVWATEMLVSRYGGRREGGRGVVAPSKCYGTGSSCMGVAHHRQRSVLRSVLGLGRTSGYRIRRCCRPRWKALERGNDARRSSGRAERYACVEAPRGFIGAPQIHDGQIGGPHHAYTSISPERYG